MDPGIENSELAVEALLGELALARLGTLLQSARVQRSSTRREVASKVGTTARALRRYETGTTPVPLGVISALAEFYGEDLSPPFAPRAPLIESPRVVDALSEARVSSGDADEVLCAYVAILRRESQRALDEPVALHAGDIAALSAVLGVDPEYVEERIAELLTFTTGLRRDKRLRRRNRILSGAGLAVLLATGTGFAIGSLVAAAPSPADPFSAVVPSSSTTVAAPTSVAVPTTVAVATTVAVPTTVGVTTTVAVPTTVEPQSATAVIERAATAPPTTELAIGTAVTLVEPTTTAASTTTTASPRPHIRADPTPIGIPGSEPVTIITSPPPG